MIRSCEQLVAALTGIALAGCWGTIGDPGGTGDDSACGPVPAAHIRRLSHVEYRNTVRDLLPGIEVPDLQLAPDPTPHGFDNDTASLTAQPLLVTQYNAAAITLSEVVRDNRMTVLPCAATADQACGHTWVRDFATRAFRRPLSPSELSAFDTIFDGYFEAEGFDVALQLTTQAILQAPAFLYRVESGTTAPTAYDLASRLSYFLWATMPDQALFDSAQTGQLTTDAQIQMQVSRMLEDPRALDGFMNFTRQWLDMSRIDRISKNGGDGWSDDVRLALKEEAKRFLEEVIYRRGGTVEDLLLSDKAFIGPETAAFYGLPAPTEWTEVSLPPERVGFMMQSQFLAATGHPNNPSPVQRGLFVLRNLLCVELGAPPAGADMTIPGPEEGVPTTNRMNYERVTGAELCQSCHASINPIGFAFENYDTFGRHITVDNTLTIDASGAVNGVAVNGARELAEYLATSEQVQQCVTAKYLTYALGGVEEGRDACLVADVQADLAATGGSLTHMMQSIATHPRFLGTAEERGEVSP